MSEGTPPSTQGHSSRLGKPLQTILLSIVTSQHHPLKASTPPNNPVEYSQLQPLKAASPPNNPIKHQHQHVRALSINLWSTVPSKQSCQASASAAIAFSLPSAAIWTLSFVMHCHQDWTQHQPFTCQGASPCRDPGRCGQISNFAQFVITNLQMRFYYFVIIK